MKLRLFVVVLISFFASQAHAGEAWEYSEVKDVFTDKTHHLASVVSSASLSQSPVKISFECRNGKNFVFTSDVNQNLGGRNVAFTLHYRVDNKRSKKVKMRTFSNSETGGMHRFNAIDIANDMLNAKRLRVRVISASGDRYDAELPLDQSRTTILKTVNACGLAVER